MNTKDCVMKRLTFIMSTVFTAIALTACGGGETEELALTRATTISNITNTAAKAGNTIEQTILENSANTTMASQEIDKSLARSHSEVSKQFKILGELIANSRAARTLSRSTHENAAEQMSLADQNEALIRDILDTMMVNPAQEGDYIVYTANPNIICADSKEAFVDCEAFVVRLKVFQLIDSDTSGSLSMRLDNNEYFMIDYASNSVAFEVVLDGLKYIMDQLGIDDEVIYTRYEGRLRYLLKIPSEHEAIIQFSIPAQVEVKSSDENASVDLFIAASNTGLLVEGNKQTNTGKITVDFGTFDQRSSFNFLESTYSTEFHWDLHKGVFVYTNTDGHGVLDIQNYTIGDTENENEALSTNISVDIDGVRKIESSMEIAFSRPLNVNIKSATKQISFTDGFGINLVNSEYDNTQFPPQNTANEVNAIIAESTDISIVQVSNSHTTTDTIAKLETGSIEITHIFNDIGSPDLPTTTSLSVTAEQCFTETDQTNALPITLIDCPQ